MNYYYLEGTTASSKVWHLCNRYLSTRNSCKGPLHRTAIVSVYCPLERRTLSLRLRHGTQAFVTLAGFVDSMVPRGAPSRRMDGTFPSPSSAETRGFGGLDADWLKRV